MISEREYNRGAPELEAECEIEWRPYKGWPYQSTTFTVLYEMDGGCHLCGAWLKDGENDGDDILDTFTDEQRSQAEQDCIDDYNYRCDMEAAKAEEYEGC